MRFVEIDEVTWAIWALTAIGVGMVFASICTDVDPAIAVPVIGACTTGIPALARGRGKVDDPPKG